MRIFTILTALIIILASCQSNTKKENTEKDKNFEELMDRMQSKAKVHAVKVLESEDAGKYTYVKLKEGDKKYWAAITARPVEIGETYYYSQGMMMKDFQSKELNKTFDSVMFIQQFAKKPMKEKIQGQQQGSSHDHTKSIQKSDISVDPAEGGITIKELYQNKQNYKGKKVSIRGQVVKINTNIMGRNWIHIQDGTRDGDNFDLTVTSSSPVNFKVGDVVTFEGIIDLDKDFGSGYQYDVIMEKAGIVKGQV
ncbi:MAG: GW dipeptide domain-containing protein [Bacteroidales bacterium]|nr:GW dipeptide domain-containing protein [Bacteroidales bacterium]MCF8387083.1 GW dipeptide domain-containing protein [Bacteroidales bacterium]MCF8399037.1 GW dipeptide domain-containing protein [Bacteroidales bacterium]